MTRAVNQGRLRSGHTLIELTVAIVAASVLMMGLTSAMFIGLKATDFSSTPTAATIAGNQALSEVLSELEFAIALSEQSVHSLTFYVPDRDGDSNPEMIRYAWSGTPGDPLTRQYNGGNVVTVAEDIHMFEHDLPPLGPNLLSNPGMESGSTDWQGIPGCTMTSRGSPVHTGSQVMEAWRNSFSFNAGIEQDVTSQITSGVTYKLSAWLLKSSPENPDDVKLQLRVDSSGEGVQYFSVAPVNVPAYSWIQCRGRVTPKWSGTLNSAHWQALGVTNFKDLYVDDVAMREIYDMHQHVNVWLQVGDSLPSQVCSGRHLINSPL